MGKFYNEIKLFSWLFHLYLHIGKLIGLVQTFHKITSNMKKLEVLFFLLILAGTGYSQTGNLLLSSGFITTDDNRTILPNTYSNGQGWRVTAAYEELSVNNKWAYGINAGYQKTFAYLSPGEPYYYPDYSTTLLPVYYSHKFLFGNEYFRGYVKGLVGFSFSNYKYSHTYQGGWANGFLTGAGAGSMYWLKNKKTFLFADYEFQARYTDFNGFRYSNSISVGIGFRIK